MPRLDQQRMMRGLGSLAGSSTYLTEGGEGRGGGERGEESCLLRADVAAPGLRSVRLSGARRRANTLHPAFAGSPVAPSSHPKRQVWASLPVATEAISERPFLTSVATTTVAAGGAIP